MKKIIVTLSVLLGGVLVAGPAGAWSHANHYGGSTSHSYGSTSHTNAYGGSTQHAYGERDLLQRIPFVAMEAALHRHHRLSAERAAQQPAGVTLHRRQREAGNVGVLDGRRDVDLSRESAEPRAQNDRHLGHASSIRARARGATGR